MDAALLAARSPDGGAIAPAQFPLGRLSLDLRGLPLGLARSRSRRVGSLLGPGLLLAEATRLFLATGAIPPPAAAAALASSCEANRFGGLKIAAVRGEDVLHRLEELGLASIEPPETEIADGERRSAPVAASAQAPGMIAEAADAAVLASRSLLADDHGDQTKVSLWFEDGFRVLFCVDADDAPDELLREVEGLPLVGCESEVIASPGVKIFRLSAARRAELLQACRQLDMVMGGVAGPIEDLIVAKHVKHEAWVDRGLLEFDLDTRPAAEWLDA